MTDEEIRQLVRRAIATHLGSQAPAEPRVAPHPAGGHAAHVAFHRYQLPRSDGDTACLIEPAVTCNHCGYCQCHGH